MHHNLQQWKISEGVCYGDFQGWLTHLCKLPLLLNSATCGSFLAVAPVQISLMGLSASKADKYIITPQFEKSLEPFSV